MREQIRVDSHEICESALQAAYAAHHAINFIHWMEGGDTGSNLFNDPCHIKTKYCRERLPGMLCLACTNLGIQWIYAACRNPDQNLVHTKCWARNLDLPKLSAWCLHKVGLHMLG